MQARVKHHARHARVGMHVCLMCAGLYAYLWDAHHPPACIVLPPHLLHACPQLATSLPKSWVKACLPSPCHSLTSHNLVAGGMYRS